MLKYLEQDHDLVIANGGLQFVQCNGFAAA